MDVVIFGNGGHGQDIAADLRGCRSFFLDDNPQRNGSFTCIPDRCIVGINDSSTRRAITNRLGWTQTSWFHSAARVGWGVYAGEGVHVNAGAFLTRCTLGDFVTVGPNATICGDVTIGDDVMIGAGAVIKNLLTIGDGAVIGCGAVVVHDVEPHTTVVGNPARPLIRKQTINCSIDAKAVADSLRRREMGDR